MIKFITSSYKRQIYIITATSDVTPAQIPTKTVIQSDQYNNEGNVYKSRAAEIGGKGSMAPLKIFLEGPGPSKITDDPSSVMNCYSTLYI